MKSTRFNFWRTLSILCAVFLLSFSVMSCQQEEDDEEEAAYTTLSSDDAIVGIKWADSYTSWNPYATYDCCINVDSIETASYGKQTSTIYQKKLSDTEGYLYYKISDTTSFTSSSADASTYAGKWYGLYYKDLTSTSVTMCDACPSDYATSYHCFDSLEDAVAGLTVDAGYFAYTTEFTAVTE